jgi:hypothetical protein
MTVVWNDACDPDVFHLSVVLNDDSDSYQHSIKTVPCTTGGPDGIEIPNCTWMASVVTADRREMEHSGTHEERAGRRLVIDTEAAAMDADIEALRIASEEEGSSSSPSSRDLRFLDVDLKSRIVNMSSGPDLDNGTVVTVMWMYTPSARSVWGASKLKSMVAGAVVSANLALLNSKAGFTIKCVGIFAAEGYYVDDHMAALSDMNAGRVPGLLQKRDDYRADLVQLIVEDPEFCGYGNVMDMRTSAFEKFGYSTVYSQCFSTFSHIHEIAHNMGCSHDKSNAGATSVPYAVGYRYCGAPGDFRSVMSYSCSDSTRVPYFSNPDVSYRGRPTGTSSANNARRLRENKYVVSNFRRG